MAVKLTTSMRRALDTIIEASSGRGRRGIPLPKLNSFGISRSTYRALMRRGLVTYRFTQYGRGERFMVAFPTNAGRGVGSF